MDANLLKAIEDAIRLMPMDSTERKQWLLRAASALKNARNTNER